MSEPTLHTTPPAVPPAETGQGHDAVPGRDPASGPIIIANTRPEETHSPPTKETTSDKEPTTSPAEDGATSSQATTGRETTQVTTEEAPLVTPPLSTPWLVLPIVSGAIVVSYLIYKIGKLRVAERVKRWLPMGHVVLWGVTLLLCGVVLVRTGSTAWLMLGVVVFVVLVVLNLSWLRSILAGVALTLERHLEVGDAVRLDGLEGDLVHFGLRSTRLRAIDGTLHDIPHEQLLTQRVANLSGDGSDSACRIAVRVPAGRSIEEVMRVALEVAMLSPLASPRHRPEVFLDEGEQALIYIRGYAFDPNYQEHFRSDVLKRLTRLFEEGKEPEVTRSDAARR